MYRYIKNHPGDSADPSGLKDYQLTINAPLDKNLQPTVKNAYGIFVWPADFKIQPKAACDGVIVQHVSWTIKIRDEVRLSASWWEFWSIKKGDTEPTPKIALPAARLQELLKRYPPEYHKALNSMGKHNDFYSFSGAGERQRGSIDMVGEAWFVSGDPPGPLPGQSDESGQLVIPSDGGAFIGGQYVTNELIMQIWVAAFAKSNRAPHTWRSKWKDDGATEIIEHSP